MAPAYGRVRARFQRSRKAEVERRSRSSVIPGVRARMSCRQRRSRTFLTAVALITLLAGGCAAGGSAASYPQSGRSVEVVRAAGQPDQTFVFANPTPWGSNWSYNPFSSDFLSDLNDVALLPLAIAQPSKYGNYLPELATSWQTTGSEISISLRRGARWQNGTPVTSKDVLTDLLLEGVAGNSLWTYLTSATAPSSSTVVLHLKPHTAASEVLFDSLSLFPLPTSEYKVFLIPHLASYLAGHYPSSSRQGQALARDLKSLQKFQPKSFLGDGPFKVVGATSQEVELHRSTTFWDASRIHPQAVTFMDFASNDGAWAALLSHRADFSNTGMTAPIVKKWKETPNSGYVTALNGSGWVLDFNDRSYPFNILAVRQAIAYAIDRPKMLALAFGGKAPALTAVHPDGLTHDVNTSWLNPVQLKSLNTYSYDPAKAAALLKRAHFSKRNGKWYLPNGKLFKVSMDAPAGWSAVVEVRVMASMLSSFGISATASSVEQPGYWTDQASGQFDLSYGFEGGGNLNPLAQLASVLVSQDFVSSGSSGSANPGIGFGPTLEVPGLGRVDVPATLTKEEDTANPGPEMRQLTWDWARLVNQQLPYLSYAYQYGQLSFSTSKFGDWPRPHSSLWALTGIDTGGGLLAMMQDGYIRPHTVRHS